MIECKECGHGLSDRAKSCPSCGKPHQPKATWQQAVVGGVIVVLAITFCIPGDKAEKSPDAWKHEVDQVGAASMIGQFVKKRLVSPGSAKFDGLFGDLYHGLVTHIGDQHYRADSWVDSQNAFGGLLRTKFTCEVVKVSADDWQLVELQME